MRLANNRYRLEVARSLVDMVVGLGDQVHKNSLVQVFEKTKSGQNVKGFIAGTKNTPMGPISWT